MQTSVTSENLFSQPNSQDQSKAISKMIINKNNSESIPKYLQTLMKNKKTLQQLGIPSKETTNLQENTKVQTDEKKCNIESCNNKQKAKENIQPIITESIKQSLQNVSAKLFFNSPTSKQFAFNAKLFQQIAQKQQEKESEENNTNENNNSSNLPKKRKEKQYSNIAKKGQQIKLQTNNINGIEASKIGFNEQQFIQPLPGIQNQPKKAQINCNQNALVAQSPKVLNRPASTNIRKNKNVATISLDTSDFFKLKKRLNVKDSTKALSRNHSNEQTLKTNNSNLNKDKSLKNSEFPKKVPSKKKLSKSRTKNSQSRNDSQLKIAADRQQEDKYNLDIEFTKNMTTFAKQYFDNMEKCSKQACKPKVKRQMTQHEFKNFNSDTEVSNQKINMEMKNIKNTHVRKISANSKKNSSIPKKNEYQLMLQTNNTQSKHQFKVVRNSNLKINNFVNNEKETQKMAMKTMSHKNLSSKNQKNEAINNKAKNFNFYNKEKTEELNNCQKNPSMKEKSPPNLLDIKLLQIKTNIAVGQNQVEENESKPKTTTAENSKIFTFVSKFNEKKKFEAGGVRSSYDNNQLITVLKKENELKADKSNKNCQQQQQNELSQQKKHEGSKNSKNSKSKNPNNQAKHVRNFTTSDLNSKNNLEAKQQPKKSKVASANLQSLVTSVKFGQGLLGPSKVERTSQSISSQTKSPTVPIIDVLAFQELYYIPKIIESFMLDTDDYFVSLFREHLIQTLQTVHFTNFIKQISNQVIQSKQITLEKKVNKKKTIIFDLDETLIHCNETLDIPSEIVLPIQFPTGEQIQAGVNVRPYTKQCLQTLSQYYEIIVFTASHSCYADVVLDYLDPDNKYISHRLFRENCIQTEEGIYVKDLRIFKNRNLQDILIVDNAAYSFAFHLNNGIPIVPFYDNQEDTELKDLTNYLVQLAKCNNIVEINSNVFKFTEYAQYNNPIELLESLYPQFIETEVN